MKHQRAIAKNYAIQFIGRAVSVTIGLFTIAFITRALGDAGFGEFTTAVTYLLVATVVVDFGLTLIFIQMISKPGADESRIASALLGLRLISATLFLALAAGFAFLTPYSLTIKLAIAVGTLSYLGLTSSGMMTGVYQKHLAINRAVLAELLNRALTFGLVIWFAAANYGVIAMIIAIGAGNILQLILMVILAQKFMKVRPTIDIEIWRAGLRESWPIGVGIFFNLLYLKSDILILGFYAPQAEVGIYGAAYRVIDVFTALPVLYMGLILPQLVRTWSRKLKAEFNTYLQTTFDFFSIFAIPLLVGTWIVGVPLMELVAGKDFARSGEVLPILMLVMPAIFIGALTGHAIVAIGKQKQMLVGYVFTAVVALVGYFIFIPKFGMLGAAWMTVVSEYLINILTALVVFWTARYRPRLSVLAKSLLASAIMYQIIQLLPDYHVLITIGIGGTVYAITIIALGGVKLSTIRGLLIRETL